jgi:hypothetical protein
VPKTSSEVPRHLTITKTKSRSLLYIHYINYYLHRIFGAFLCLYYLQNEY